MNNSMKKIIITAGICTSSLLLANENTVELDQVLITEKNEILELRKESINSKIVIDENKIKQFSDTNAGEVLRRLPGVTFSGSPSESKDVRLRGLDKEYTQILINGQRVPGSGEKREFQIDLIPSNMIERIEIIRTPNSTMDSQGIAGTINIILKQTPKSRLLTASLGMSKLENNKYMPNEIFFMAIHMKIFLIYLM